MNFSVNDYKILLYLYEGEYINELKACTIIQIKEELKFSLAKIRNTLNNFIKEKYVEHGFNNATAKTYYITKEGIETIKKLM